MSQFGNTLRKLPQSTKVALAGLLFAALVAVWYLVANRVGQPVDSGVVPPTPSEGTAPTRSLEVVALPFLKGETAPSSASQAPEAEEGAAQPAQASPGPTAPGRLQVQAPPNPFVPLFPTETPQPAATPQPATPPVVAQTPPPTRAIPSGPRVQVSQPQTALPSPNIRVTAPASTPRPVATSGSQARLPAANPRAGGSEPAPAPSLSGGALPLRLSPLEREVPTAQATRPSQPQVAQPGEANLGASANLPPVSQQGQPNPTLEPKATPTTPTAPAVKTPTTPALNRFVQEQNLRLVGVVLGPTSVGIFQGKNGFFVLPVGRNFPESEVLLKTLTAREALLVLGSESLTLELVNP